jgi:predicted dehydrogenase
MGSSRLRIGLIGAGANMRARHLPGFRAIPDVEIVAVCNRRPSSTEACAREFGIPLTFDRWQDVVARDDLDAIVIGTWPYLHCAITLAALETNKHVLTEARLSSNAKEAHQILRASKRYPKQVIQIVPSPYGLKGHDVMLDMIQSGSLGELREARIVNMNNALADAAAPLSWRQDAALSGFNMLTLGIVHETFQRWAPRPVRVLAQAHAFIPSRIDPESGVRRPVGTPDSVQVLAILENGARAVYQLSGVTSFGQSAGIWLYGTEGVLYYDFLADRIHGVSRRRSLDPLPAHALEEISIPEAQARTWEVEADFIDAIRNQKPIRFTDLPSGVAYMEFTEAVAQSAERGSAVDLPLEEFLE